MRGAAVFLVSLAAVAGIAVGVLLPLWHEKQDLLKVQPTEGSPAASAPDAGAAEVLLMAFDPPPDRWEKSLDARLAALLEKAGAPTGDCRVESGRATLRLPVEGLPIFLSGLAERPIPPIDSLSVTGERGVDSYDVRITFLLSPSARGGR